MNNILKNISEIRKQKGYSQEYIAIQLDMKHAGYNLIENGKRELKYTTLLHIAKILEISVIDIITYPEKYVPLNKAKEDPVEAILQIKLNGNKKEQVLSLVLGDNHLEILNK